MSLIDAPAAAARLSRLARMAVADVIIQTSASPSATATTIPAGPGRRPPRPAIQPRRGVRPARAERGRQDDDHPHAARADRADVGSAVRSTAWSPPGSAARQATVGYLPDDVGFYDDMTGRQNLRYTARLNRLPAGMAEERIDRLLDDVGLTDVGRPQGQRLLAGHAPAPRPGRRAREGPVDPHPRRADGEHRPRGRARDPGPGRRLRDERSVTVLLSSHLLHQVEQVCDRIGIFLRGRLVALGTMEKLAAALEDRWAVEVGVGAA